MGESVPVTAPPDTVGGDRDLAPSLPGQFGGDPPRSKTWVGEGEGQDPVLDPLRKLVGHPRAPALTGAKGLQAPGLHVLGPPVVRGGWIPIWRQAARTLPSSAASANTRRRNRWMTSSVDKRRLLSGDVGVTRRMRRLSLWVWELPRCVGRTWSQFNLAHIVPSFYPAVEGISISEEAPRR